MTIILKKRNKRKKRIKRLRNKKKSRKKVITILMRENNCQNLLNIKEQVSNLIIC